MNRLSQVFVFKIAATALFWCAPLILFPAGFLEVVGLPAQPSYLFVRLLGWAYLALCVGYAFGLRESLQGKRPSGAVWMGIASNASACICLGWFGAIGTWSEWGLLLQFLLWASVVVTAAVTAGLYGFGVHGGIGRGDTSGPRLGA
jgi:hypothetical protein